MQRDLHCWSRLAWTFLGALTLWGTSLYTFTNANQGLCRSLKFSSPVEGYYFNGHVIKNMSIGIHASCKNLCTMESRCVSFNTGPPINGNVVCELSDSDHSQHPADLKPKEGFTYRATQNHCSGSPCSNNGTCLNGFTGKKYFCECSPGYAGDNCEKVVNECSDALKVNGIVEIWNHGHELFPVYCDQTSDGGGWTMIFKVVGGISSPKVGHLWNSPTTQSENVTAALDTTTKYPGHLKNRVVLNWQTFDPQEARVVLYQNGHEVVSLKFNATGTNNLDWFSQERLIVSPWNDLKTAPQLLKFGIVGFFSRFFEITLSYNTCGFDAGWLIIVHTSCSWENRVPAQSIQFSKLSTAVTWSDYGNVGIADVLAVFVR